MPEKIDEYTVTKEIEFASKVCIRESSHSGDHIWWAVELPRGRMSFTLPRLYSLIHCDIIRELKERPWKSYEVQHTPPADSEGAAVYQLILRDAVWRTGILTPVRIRYYIKRL